MSGWRQVAGGLAITLAVILIVGASLSTAIAEQRLLIEPIPPTRTSAPANPSPTLPALPTPTTAPSSEGGLATSPASPTPTATTLLSTVSPTPSPSASATSTPGGAPTITPIPCGPPGGWVIYTVQTGDTLFSLSQATNTSVAAIQAANCMGGSTYIQAGAPLFLPFIPVPTPTKTPTPSPTGSPTKTGTVPPSATPTKTATPSPTSTSSATPTPTPTETPSPTETPTGHPPTPTETGTTAAMPSSFH